MPELVEVHIIVKTINKLFKGSIINNITINSGRYTRHKFPDGYKKFIESLPATIISFNTKGKFIYLLLNDNRSIWITLGLTGELLLKPGKHSHITFFTNKGNFYFDDYRNFGTIKFSFSNDDLTKKLKTLGPDILQDNITFDHFKNIITKKSLLNKDIVLVLNNQNVLSGIGNYLRAEILYDAKINPFKKIKNLNDDELLNLWKSINKIIHQSLKKQLNNGIHTFPFKVYRKKKTPSGHIVKSKKLDDRTIWYVPSIQK
jgi:DNA-formamidopyrimidine glycosylase